MQQNITSGSSCFDQKCISANRPILGTENHQDHEATRRLLEGRPVHSVNRTLILATREEVLQSSHNSVYILLGAHV